MVLRLIYQARRGRSTCRAFFKYQSGFPNKFSD
jgi:hypothetical protein